MAQPGENAGIFGSFRQGRMITKNAIKAMRDRLDRQELASIQTNQRFEGMCDALRASTEAYSDASRRARLSRGRMLDAAGIKSAYAASGTANARQAVESAYEPEF